MLLHPTFCKPFFPMSDSNFLPRGLNNLNHSVNPKNYDLNHIMNNCSNYLTSFELCDCISALEAQLFNESSNSSLTSSATASSITRMQVNNNKCKIGIKKTMKADGHSIALRTRTHLDNLDDGFKWRKNGKKPVKTNPNPRHYYKCASERCQVKKTVERDGEDSSCLLIKYKGRHNHKSPCITYHEKDPSFDFSTTATLLQQPSKLLMKSSSF